MRKRKVDTIRYCGQWRITLWSNDESRDEEKDDGSTWKICKIPRIELTKKCGDWIHWDICDKCICPKCSGDEVAPKCYDKRYISEMMIFLYYLHWIINIKIKSHSILHYLQSADLSKNLSIDCVIEIYDCVNIDFSQSMVNYLFSVLFQ